MKFYFSLSPPLQIADVFYEWPQRYDRFVGPFEISGKYDLGSGVWFYGVKIAYLFFAHKWPGLKDFSFQMEKSGSTKNWAHFW